jgi:hypothetical protein
VPGVIRSAWPYRRIPAHVVAGDSWLMDPGTARERPLPGSLPDWDYQTNLRLRRRITWADDLRRAAQLPAIAKLAISVRWSVTPSYLRGVGHWAEIGDGTEHIVDFDLLGARLGGLLRIETLVVLAEEIAQQPATAHMAGSVLWSDSVTVRLQGDAALYPVALVPFSKASLPDKAAWYLELGSDLSAAAMGSMQLLVNQDHPVVAASVGAAAAPTEANRLVLSTLRSDLVRGMVEHALADDEFTMSENYGEETLGAVLQGLLRTQIGVDSDDALHELRTVYMNDRQRFAAAMQHDSGFLEAPR